MDIRKLLDWNYLTITPSAKFSYQSILLFLLICLCILALVCYIEGWGRISHIKLNKKLFNNFGTFLFLMDIAGFVILISRTQELPFFSIRLILLIWIFGFIAGCVGFCLYLLTKYRRKLSNYYKEQLRRQYIPKKKNL